MQTYHIGMTPQFRRALSDLNPRARGDVLDALMKLADGLGSVHVHKLQSSGFVSFEVARNALRVICQRDGDLLILLHVAAHDEAYAWSTRHRVVRVGDVVRFLSVATTEGTASVEDEAHGTKGPLAEVRDRVFARFGIGPHAAGVLRRACSCGGGSRTGRPPRSPTWSLRAWWRGGVDRRADGCDSAGATRPEFVVAGLRALGA